MSSSSHTWHLLRSFRPQCCGSLPCARECRNLDAQDELSESHSLHCSSTQPSMKQFTPEQKHEILLEYSPRSTTHSLVALAQGHAVKGGRRTIENWLARWDGSAASLQRKQVSGRPRSLTPEEVQRHITAPIAQAAGLDREGAECRGRLGADAA